MYFESYLKVHFKVYVKVVYSWFSWNPKGRKQSRNCSLHLCLKLIFSVGVPVLMSTPHFLDGNPILAAAINGLEPDRKKHLTYINLEPMTGTVDYVVKVFL